MNMIIRYLHHILIAAAILGAAPAAEAQTEPSIEVTGTATVYIVPDRITVEIGMEEYFKPGFIDSTKVKIADIERDVRKVLKKAGVKESSVTVTDMGNYRDRAMSTKFLMAKRISAVVSDFDELDKIAANLPERGVTSFQITKLDNTDMEKYNREGLKSALEAARSKAEFIAKEEGLSITSPLEIVENGSNYYETPSFSNVAYDSGSGMENMRRIVRRYSVKARYLFRPR